MQESCAKKQVEEELKKEKAALSQVEEELAQEKKAVSGMRDELDGLREELTQQGSSKDEAAKLEERLQEVEKSRSDMEKVSV